MMAPTGGLQHTCVVVAISISKCIRQAASMLSGAVTAAIMLHAVTAATMLPAALLLLVKLLHPAFMGGLRRTTSIPAYPPSFGAS